MDELRGTTALWATAVNVRCCTEGQPGGLAFTWSAIALAHHRVDAVSSGTSDARYTSVTGNQFDPILLATLTPFPTS